MVGNLFAAIIDNLKEFFHFVAHLPLTIRLRFIYIKNYLVNLKENLKNLTHSNIELGKYHLRLGNYNDAIFRFKLVDLYLDKNSTISNYWLGWVYFLKGNYIKALAHLEKAGSEDKVSLANFIRNISNNNVTAVPTDILRLYRDITASAFIDKFYGKRIDDNIPAVLITKLNSVISKLPPQYSILELGSNIGLIGQEIDLRMPDGFILTGVETSAELIHLQDIYLKRDGIYNILNQQDALSYLKQLQDKKYDIIVSLGGLAYIENLTLILTLISERLNYGGYFALAFPTAVNHKFLPSSLEFLHNSTYIRETLRTVGLRTKLETEIKLEFKNNYTIFVGIKEEDITQNTHR